VLKTVATSEVCVDAIWASYKANGGRELRDKLILHYRPMVGYVARQVAGGLAGSDLDDLMSFATFGLLDAIEKFDPSREAKFETYAVTRIKGQILDELRALDWVPRSVRAKTRVVEKANSRLEALLGRSPTDTELADELGITATALAAVTKEAADATQVRLDAPVSSGTGNGDDSSATLADTVADRDRGAAGGLDLEQMTRHLAKEINRLGERTRIVLVLNYEQGLSLAAIGDVLGVTESRVCQLHTKAMQQLAAVSWLPTLAAARVAG